MVNHQHLFNFGKYIIMYVTINIVDFFRLVCRSDLVSLLASYHTEELYFAQCQCICSNHKYLPAGPHLQVSL